MNEKALNSFKLAGLRAGALVEAAAQDSTIVRSAMKFNLWRRETKLGLKRTFKKLKTRPISGSKLRFLVHIRGGIGDVCMSRILIKKLREVLPQAEISFTHDSQTVVNMVFSDDLIDRFEPLGYLPEQFDVVLSGCHLLMYDFVNLPRVQDLAPHFIPILQKGQDVQSCFKVFATYSPYLDGQLAEIAIAHGGSRVTNLGWFSGLEIAQNDQAPIQLNEKVTQQTLEKLGLLSQSYVTIHDGINIHTDTSLGHPTRCWPEAHWREFARLFKTAFPTLKIVQMGGSKSHAFDFADISLIGKTTVTDLPHILSHSQLHIDGESGMVHLANLTQTPCVVLFGPSKPEYLAYARNTNIQASFCGGCMNISKHWMTQCMLGYPPEKQCLAAISPQQVFEATKKAFSVV